MWLPAHGKDDENQSKNKEWDITPNIIECTKKEKIVIIFISSNCLSYLNPNNGWLQSEL